MDKWYGTENSRTGPTFAFKTRDYSRSRVRWRMGVLNLNSHAKYWIPCTDAVPSNRHLILLKFHSTAGKTSHALDNCRLKVISDGRLFSFPFSPPGSKTSCNYSQIHKNLSTTLTFSHRITPDSSVPGETPIDWDPVAGRLRQTYLRWAGGS